MIESGEPIQFEEAVPSLEGERVYVFGEMPAARSYGQALRRCGIATDITAFKRAEEM